MIEPVAAADMARERGVDPKRFRAALREEGFAWHAPNGRWRVERGSERHRALEQVLAKIVARRG